MIAAGAVCVQQVYVCERQNQLVAVDVVVARE